MKENQMEDLEEVSRYGNGRGNGRESHWVTSERDQRERQEEEWALLVSGGRRGEDILAGQ